jgi:hypothetical protein
LATLRGRAEKSFFSKSEITACRCLCNEFIFDFVSESPMSPEAQQLIAQCIPTIEQLEVFLTLAKNPAEAWSVGDIFRKVQSNENSISRCLESLVRNGLAIALPEGRFKLADDAKVQTIAAELAQAYRERYVAVIGMIYGKPDRQIQSFANAFKFRKEK